MVKRVKSGRMLPIFQVEIATRNAVQTFHNVPKPAAVGIARNLFAVLKFAIRAALLAVVV